MFGTLAILDVGPRYVPAHDPSMIIAKGIGLSQAPAILSILSMDTYFRFPGLAVRNPFLESALETRQVIRMKAAAIVHDKKFFERVTVVLEDRLIGVKATSLRI